MLSTENAKTSINYLEVLTRKINDPGLYKELRVLRKRVKSLFLKPNGIINPYYVILDSNTNKLYLREVTFFTTVITINNLIIIKPEIFFDSNNVSNLYYDNFKKIINKKLDYYSKMYFNNDDDSDFLLDDLNDSKFFSRVLFILENTDCRHLQDYQIDRFCEISDLYIDQNFNNFVLFTYLSRENRLKLFKALFGKKVLNNSDKICSMIRYMKNINLLSNFESVFNIDYSILDNKTLLNIINEFPLKINTKVSLKIEEIKDSFEFLRIYNSFCNLYIINNDIETKITDTNIKYFINNLKKLAK